jgi:glycerol-3-phosphate acyltransferase PlsY
MTITYIIVAAVAYLLGSIPFGLILVKLFTGTDVRQIGSGNIGATNVMRTGSKGLGIATLVLDAAKGYCAVLLAILLGAASAGPDLRSVFTAAGIAAVFAMVGHVFPVWLGFKGGKGVATGVGVFLALVPKAVLIVLGVFAVIFAASKYVSLASIIATAAFPVVAYAFLRGNGDYILLPFIVTAAVLIIAKHHTNIRRLMAGTEHRLELKHR